MNVILTQRTRESVRRGAKKAADDAMYRIDGCMMSMRDIASALRLSETSVRKRMAALRNASGAITLDRLRNLGK